MYGHIYIYISMHVWYVCYDVYNVKMVIFRDNSQEVLWLCIFCVECIPSGANADIEIGGHFGNTFLTYHQMPPWLRNLILLLCESHSNVAVTSWSLVPSSPPPLPAQTTSCGKSIIKILTKQRTCEASDEFVCGHVIHINIGTVIFMDKDVLVVWCDAHQTQFRIDLDHNSKK